VSVISDQGGLLFAAGELVAVNRAYTVNRRSNDDFFGATIEAAGYQVDSLLPAAGQVELRRTGRNYPNWVSRRYLRLPRAVPARVLSLARDLTATAATPYDQAKAIENYLRAFPYTLDLPEPPPDRDLADYFLFELQQGYCDYYATAMVVLARAAGLPARLAIGYIGGAYDAGNGHYVVTEAEAHSWVEVYFPEYGWINFEPTGGRPALERSSEPDGSNGLPEAALPPAAPTVSDELSRWGLGLAGGLVLLVGAGLGGLALDSWRLRRASPAQTVTTLYKRLQRHGQRLTGPGTVGETPYEFAASLAERIITLSHESRWAGIFEAAPSEVRGLTELYVKTLFGPHPPDSETQKQAIRTWLRLRRRLWLLWLRFTLKSKR
jgi:transglutaminase-like putative cysteine protease